MEPQICWNYNKRSNIHIIGVLEVEEKEDRAKKKKVLKKVEAYTVSILANNKIKNKHTGSRSWTIPNRIGPKNCMLRYIFIKLLRFYLKTLKAASEKGHLAYREKNNKNENRTLSRNPEGQEKVAQHL